MRDDPFVAESPKARFFRYFVLAVAGAQTVFWLYTFRLIYVNANPMGDGFEFVAVVPFGFVFLALVAPSLLLGSSGKKLALCATLAVAGLILNAFLFLEIASELTGDGAHSLKF